MSGRDSHRSRHELVIRALENAFVRIKVVEHDARTAYNCGERVGCDRYLNAERTREVFRQAADERHAARQIDAFLHHVADDLGRRRLEDLLDLFDELFYRVADCIPNILVGDKNLAREARHDVAATNDRFDAVPARCYGRDRYLELFRRFLANEHFELVADVRDDIGVEFVACYAHVARAHESAERDDADVRRTPADIDNHAASRLEHGKLDADSGRHRLFEDMRSEERRVGEE